MAPRSTDTAGRDARGREPGRVPLAVPAQRVELGGHHVRRRQAGQVLRAQRRGQLGRPRPPRPAGSAAPPRRAARRGAGPGRWRRSTATGPGPGPAPRAAGTPAAGRPRAGTSTSAPRPGCRPRTPRRPRPRPGRSATGRRRRRSGRAPRRPARPRPGIAAPAPAGSPPRARRTAARTQRSRQIASLTSSSTEPSHQPPPCRNRCAGSVPAAAGRYSRTRTGPARRRHHVVGDRRHRLGPPAVPEVVQVAEVPHELPLLGDREEVERLARLRVEERLDRPRRRHRCSASAAARASRRSRCATGSGTGAAASSARVYGCSGASQTRCDRPGLHHPAAVAAPRPGARTWRIDRQVVGDEQVADPELALQARAAG